jgi:hypothetical protein
MKKKGAGRPKLPTWRAKSTTLLIRLSETEKLKIEGVARKKGEKPSAWARHILLEAVREKV